MLIPVDIIFDSDQIGTEQVTGSRDYPEFTLLPSIEDCVGLAVTYANVPFTYFVIDGTNNTFVVTDSVGPTNTTITLEEGTYNVVNIITQIRSKWSYTNWVPGTDYEIFIDSTTSKLTVYRLGASRPFTLDFSANELGKVLGFEKTTYASTDSNVTTDDDTVVVTKSNIVAPRVINLSGPAQMFLDSDIGSLVFGSVRNQSGSRGLLGFWPINSNYQGTIEYLNSQPEMIPVTKSNISKIGLKLTIGNKQSFSVRGTTTSYLPLNGEPFQVGIRFWKEVSDNNKMKDSLGNVTTSVKDMGTSLYDPRKKRNILRR